MTVILFLLDVDDDERPIAELKWVKQCNLHAIDARNYFRSIAFSFNGELYPVIDGIIMSSSHPTAWYYMAKIRLIQIMRLKIISLSSHMLLLNVKYIYDYTRTGKNFFVYRPVGQDFSGRKLSFIRIYYGLTEPICQMTVRMLY